MKDTGKKTTQIQINKNTHISCIRINVKKNIELGCVVPTGKNIAKVPLPVVSDTILSIFTLFLFIY